MRTKTLFDRTEKTFDFVEKEDSKFATQLNLFWQGLTAHGTLLGFTGAEIDEAEKDYRRMRYAVDMQSRFQAQAKASTAYKKALRRGDKDMVEELPPAITDTPPAPVADGIEKRFRKRAAKAKASPNYSSDMGIAMRIVGVRSLFEAKEHTPKFKTTTQAGHPLLKFTKKFYDAMDIWKDDGEGYKKLERVTRSKYMDKSKLPPGGKTAAWMYKIIGVIGDEPVGNFSAEATVLVSGV